MKLLKTIERLVEEAENTYYEASQKNIDPKQLRKIEEGYEESLKLLEMFKKIEKKNN
jgi:hypothetical protein